MEIVGFTAYDESEKYSKYDSMRGVYVCTCARTCVFFCDKLKLFCLSYPNGVEGCESSFFLHQNHNYF